MPHIDSGTLQRLSIATSHHSMQVGVVRSRLGLSDDGGVIRLSGNSSAVEGTEDGGRGSLDAGFGEAGVLEPVVRERGRVSMRGDGARRF